MLFNEKIDHQAVIDSFADQLHQLYAFAKRHTIIDMPILETPPNPAAPSPPPPMPDAPIGGVQVGDEPVNEGSVVEIPAGKIQTRQFGELDHTELVQLLDTLDDERSKSRFRESIYISIFFWIGVVAFLIFAPRYFPHTPQFANPSTKTTDHQITNLTIPPDVQRALDHAPRSKPTPKALAPSVKPQLQPPAPPAPAPKAVEQPPQQPAPQAAAPPQPPPVVQQSPLPTPRSSPQQNVAALPAAPAPSTTANRPNFGNPNTSARDLVRQAGQGLRGGGIDDGPSGGVVHHGLGAGVEVLTPGFQDDDYLRKIIAEIRTTWEPLIPEEARPPLNKQGETQIRFIILADGRIGGMTLEGSTHDDAINNSCWGSITGVGQFPPLPSQFHGPSIELRVHYLVNKEPR